VKAREVKKLGGPVGWLLDAVIFGVAATIGDALAFINKGSNRKAQ
jgi:hypothetical protein